MIEIDDKLLSDDLFEACFSCDLQACKGACCIEGDYGAPLTIEEVDVLEEALEKIKPFMTPEGIAAVERQGVFEVDETGDYTTTLIDGGPCAFVTEEEGIALCAVERACRAGAIGFLKPISCHLYPIRTKIFGNGMVGMNYHRWDICRDAVRCGVRNRTKVYQSVRPAIERAFGTDFYRKMEEADRLLEQQRD